MDSQSECKHILVTGATGGIGSAVCRRLAALGLKPLVGHRDAQTAYAHALAKECGGLPLSLDLGDPNSIDGAIGKCAALEGTLFHGIAHCASPAPRLAPFGRISMEDMTLFWQVNVIGPHRLFSGLVTSLLRKKRQGVIVAVTSAAMGDGTQKAMPGMGAYTISKFGLCGLLALLEAEYPWLRVVRVSPGFTRTGMLSAFDERFIEHVAAKSPLGEPDAVAEEIVQHLAGSAT